MQKIIVKLIGYGSATCIALLTIFGWLIGSPVLIRFSFNLSNPSMKLVTALSLTCLGSMLIMLHYRWYRCAACFGLGALMVISLFTTVTDLFFKDVYSMDHGNPSFGTALCTICVSAYGVLESLERGRVWLPRYVLGSVTVASGLLALLGFVTGQSFLYFDWPGISNGMAINTALSFSILGGLVLLNGNKDEVGYVGRK